MSTLPIDSAMLETVKEFVEILKKQPALIFNPELKFLRDYLVLVGAKLPSFPGPTKSTGSGDSPKAEFKPKPSPKVDIEEDMDVEEPEEPFPDLPQEGVLDADEVNSNQDMGTEAEVSEESMDKSNELKSEAVGLFNEGNLSGAVDKYTEAIKLNGQAAVLFAKRGQAYLRLEKPNACIKDCTKALELNPDSAIAYKFRGRAHRLLGHWEEAAADLRQACKIDMDEQVDEWLKEAQPNARKVEEWRIRKKLREEERDIKERKKKAQDRARAHAERASAHKDDDGSAEDFFGGMGGIMNDPEIIELMADPVVDAAFKDIGQNPANLLKYQSNPKVMKLLQLFQKKMGGMGGMGGMPGMGGMGGGMPGMGGMGGGMPGGMGGIGGMGGFPGMAGMGGGMPGGMGGFDFGGFGGAGADAEVPPQPKPTPKPPGDDLD